jgi:NADH-quinone oxidoreductase E subunit
VLLTALHHIQHEYGWIPMQAIEEVAEFLEMSPAEALDTATFYEEYWLKPKGKYLIQVCRSLSCEICGSRDLTQRVKDKLGIEFGETTADGRFTLVELECLGSCGTAPAALVNEVLYESQTPQQFEKVLDELPEDVASRLKQLMDYEFVDQQAQRSEGPSREVGIKAGGGVSELRRFLHTAKVT